MFQSVTEQGSGTGDESLFAGVQDTALSREPGALMVQNGTGRYGVQYDQTTVNRLYHDGLIDLLDPVSGHHGFPPGQLPGGMGARGEPGEQLGVL